MKRGLIFIHGYGKSLAGRNILRNRDLAAVHLGDSLGDSEA